MNVLSTTEYSTASEANQMRPRKCFAVILTIACWHPVAALAVPYGPLPARLDSTLLRRRV